VKTAAIFLAAVAAAISARADLLLPTATGTTWKYQMIQEFGNGVHPGADENVKLDPDGKLRLPVIIFAAGTEKIDGIETTRYDLYRQGRVQLTEFLKVDEQGVTALARSAEDGEKSELAPPQKILSFPPRAGEKWNYSGRVGEIETSQAYEIVARESVEVPAGKFDAFHLRLTQLIPTPPNIVEERWFVPNLGYVKILTTMTREGGGLLERIDLQLSERPAIGQRPAAAAATPVEKKLLHAALAKEILGEPTGRFAAETEKIFCRWQGDALHEGDKIRAVWIAEDVGDVAPKNYKIAETSTSADGPQAAGTFTLSRPTNGWPIGKYRVEIYDGDQLAEMVKFETVK
jgi:hypothetical protein